MNIRFGVSLAVSLSVVLAACSPSGESREERSAPPVPADLPEMGSVYTANERGNSISFIDLKNGRVKSIAVPFTPHNVQVSDDGRWLLAVGPGSMADKDAPMDMSGDEESVPGTLMILDAETLAVTMATRLEIGRSPAHVIIDPKGARAYATNSGDNNVLVVDVARKKVVGEIKVGAAPHGLRMSPDGTEIYAANVGDNNVSVINVAQTAEVIRIAVGKAPVQVGFSPDGSRAYVSLRDENAVAVIDTVARRVVARVAVGRSPIQVFVTPDGRDVYVANQGSESEPDNRVSVIDAATNKVVATLTTGQGAHGVAASSDGTRVFISNITESTVSIIDTATRKVISTVPVGEGPNGISFRSGQSPQAIRN